MVPAFDFASVISVPPRCDAAEAAPARVPAPGTIVAAAAATAVRTAVLAAIRFQCGTGPPRLDGRSRPGAARGEHRSYGPDCRMVKTLRLGPWSGSHKLAQRSKSTEKMTIGRCSSSSRPELEAR